MINVNIETVSVRASGMKETERVKMEWKRIYGIEFFLLILLCVQFRSVVGTHCRKKNEERTTEKERKTRIWSSDVKEQFRIENVQFIDASDNKTVVNLFLILFLIFFPISFLNLITVN